MYIQKWNSSMIMEFLETLEKYKVLWDTQCTDFMNRNKRVQAFDDLLKDLIGKSGFEKLDLATLKSRMKCIKTVYRQELNKVLKSKRSGCSPDDVYKPKLIWFNKANSFLYNAALFKDGTNNTVIPESLDLSSAGDLETITSLETPLTLKTVSLTTQPFKASQKQKLNLQDESFAKRRKSNETTREVEDEYEIFAKHISSQLRKLPERSFIVIQEEIQKLITRERLLHLPTSQNVVYSEVSVQSPTIQQDIHSTSYANTIWDFEGLNSGSPSSPSSPGAKCEVLEDPLLDFDDYNL